jgi:hypothetical protein
MIFSEETIAGQKAEVRLKGKFVRKRRRVNHTSLVPNERGSLRTFTNEMNILVRNYSECAEK